MLFYRAALDLSRPTLTFVADPVREHRSRIGSWWRALSSHRQALLVLVLVHLRRNDTFARLAAAFGIGTATAHRELIWASPVPPGCSSFCRELPSWGCGRSGQAHAGARRPTAPWSRRR
ncbi:transposase family protein [Actinomadura rubrisoli]|uniref:transposase family protein n=1 Tax=Actinomadura rubrisoli TaxID=2530368 RepID=UPI001404E60D